MYQEVIDNPDQKERIFCSKCKNSTNHIVYVRLKISDDDVIEDHGAIDWWNSYEIIKCLGCDTASFRHSSYFSENSSPWEDGIEHKLYPHREKDGKAIISFSDTPMKLDKLYAETVNAYNADLLILCSGGIRSIIECICNDRNIKGGNLVNEKGLTIFKDNLQGKIFGLSENGFITKMQSDGLHQHRYLGNDALHDIKIPSKKELSLAIEILEHAIKQIYEIPENTKMLELLREKRNKV